MSILTRFKDIMASNINALLDKVEDPEKLIDQYMRNFQSDLGKVKAETATVMAEEKRIKRALDECQAEINSMQNYAVKALEAGNEDDARKFLEKKASLTAKETDLQKSYTIAASNSAGMKQMHDKLVADISELESRQAQLKSKLAVAKTQERLNKIGSSVAGANQSLSAFGRMEDKVNKALDEAVAMAELNAGEQDDTAQLAAKYETRINVDDELAALKEQLKNKE